MIIIWAYSTEVVVKNKTRHYFRAYIYIKNTVNKNRILYKTVYNWLINKTTMKIEKLLLNNKKKV